MAKEETYRVLNKQLQALLEGEHDLIANMANASALLFMSLPDINWAGFYLYKESELILGPFQGRPACIHIAMGSGVCGTSAKTGHVQRIGNVHEFPGHIACDGASNSEIVLPLYKDGILLGVLDIDSPTLDRFDEHDEQGLSIFVDILEKSL